MSAEPVRVLKSKKIHGTREVKINFMSEYPPLSDTQKAIITKFYISKNKKISLDKVSRSSIWDKFIETRDIAQFENLKAFAPALYYEIKKALTQDRNIQSAVFSECVYSQALADHFGLIDFNYFPSNEKIELAQDKSKQGNIQDLTVRYSYSHSRTGDILYQAGGAGGVDCALRVQDFPAIAMIELKEPYARASDPNLPKYEKNGLLISSEKFEKENPQFHAMLAEQISGATNIFDHLGSNINNFSSESIEKALTENYQGDKFADVICTEDSIGNLVMIPANHVSMWARMEGEIRPSGRNSCKAWSSVRLLEVLERMGAKHKDQRVEIDLNALRPTKARGGNQISRFRIDPIFFIRAKDVAIVGGMASFELKSVMQNIPSITAKMNFENLDIEEVRHFYLRAK
jgi:hypothetical protein